MVFLMVKGLTNKKHIIKPLPLVSKCDFGDQKWWFYTVFLNILKLKFKETQYKIPTFEFQMLRNTCVSLRLRPLTLKKHSVKSSF